MDIDSPYRTVCQQQGETPESQVAQSPLIEPFNSVVDENNGAISVVYDKARRSISPRVAEYIFPPGSEIFASSNTDAAREAWSISNAHTLTELELKKLTKEHLFDLQQLALGLWDFGAKAFLNCRVHFDDILSHLKAQNVASVAEDGGGARSKRSHSESAARLDP
jgi:hypothetical protein